MLQNPIENTFHSYVRVIRHEKHTSFEFKIFIFCRQIRLETKVSTLRAPLR